MNPTAHALWLGLKRSNAFIDTFSTGLEGDDWLQRPDGLPDSAIWILGHLAHSRAKFLKMLIGKKLEEEGWMSCSIWGPNPEIRRSIPAWTSAVPRLPSNSRS